MWTGNEAFMHQGSLVNRELVLVPVKVGRGAPQLRIAGDGDVCADPDPHASFRADVSLRFTRQSSWMKPAYTTNSADAPFGPEPPIERHWS